MKDPFSTFTNAAYVIAGIFVATMATTFLHWIYAASLVLLGVGSGLYHARRSVKSVWWDRTGMFWATPALFFVCLEAFTGWLWIPTVVCVAVCTGMMVFQDALWTKFGWGSKHILPVFGGLIALLIAPFQPFTAAVSAIIFAFGFALRESAGWFEEEKFPVYDHLHGAWHLITGVGYALVFYLVMG